jgi:hypothetical protein
VLQILGSYAASDLETLISKHIPRFAKYRSVCSDKMSELRAVLYNFVKLVGRFPDKQEVRMLLKEAIVELKNRDRRSDAGFLKMKTALASWADMY